MDITNDLAYAGDPAQTIKISGVHPMDDYNLWVRFNTGEAKIVDFEPLVCKPAFAPLADQNLFRSVYIDYGVTVWNDSEIDIAPETLYDKGVAVGGSRSA